MLSANQITEFLSFNISKIIGVTKLIFCMQVYLLKLQIDVILGGCGQACTKRLLKLSEGRSSCDLFEMFSSLHHEEKYKKYLSSKHSNKNFSLEKENDGHFSFSDIIFFVKKEKLSLTFIRKRPSTALYLKPIKRVSLSHCCSMLQFVLRFYNTLLCNKYMKKYLV